MPDGSAVSRRMKVIVPESGYESPAEFSNDKGGAEKSSEQRRPVLSGSIDETDITSPQLFGKNGLFERRIDQEKGAQQEWVCKIAIRDRISCFTWTFFTMVLVAQNVP